jgi:hypothetical protein
MEGIPAIYLGRQVSKTNFRAFIYGHDGSKKLVNSWDEFEKHMQTGLWFASVLDINQDESSDLETIPLKVIKEKKDVTKRIKN